MLGRLKRLEAKIRPEGRLIFAVESSEQAGLYRIEGDDRGYIFTKSEVEAMAGVHDCLYLITYAYDDDLGEVDNANNG